MKKHISAITLLIISCTILNGCMITGPIVDDLDHYKKGDTYESIRNERLIIKNEEGTIGNEEGTIGNEEGTIGNEEGTIGNEEGTIGNEEGTIGNEVENNIKDSTDSKAIENCISARNNDSMLYEDESVIKLHNQFENTKDFCTEFIKTNPMFYNDTIGINESGEQISRDGKTIETSDEDIEIIENGN